MAAIRRIVGVGGGGGGGAPAYMSSMAAYDARVLTGTYAPTGNATLGAAILAFDATQSGATGDYTEQLVYSGSYKRLSGTGHKMSFTGGGHAATPCNPQLHYDWAGTTKPTGFTCTYVSSLAVQGSGTPPYSDNSGGAMHTYDAQCELGGYLYHGGSNSYLLDGSSFWVRQNINTGVWSTLAYPSGMSIDMVVADSVNNKILALDWQFQNFVYCVYDVAGGTWGTIRHNAGDSSWPIGVAGYKPSGGSTGTVLVSGASTAHGNSVYFTIDWSTGIIGTAGSFTQVNLGALTSVNFSSLNYDSVKDVYWGLSYTGATNIDTIYEVNASTYAVTAHSLNFLDGVTTTLPHDDAGDHGAVSPYSRTLLMEDWRALGLVAQKNGAASIIRLPA